MREHVAAREVDLRDGQQPALPPGLAGRRDPPSGVGLLGRGLQRRTAASSSGLARANAATLCWVFRCGELHELHEQHRPVLSPARSVSKNQPWARRQCIRRPRGALRERVVDPAGVTGHGPRLDRGFGRAVLGAQPFKRTIGQYSAVEEGSPRLRMVALRRRVG